MNKIIGMIIPYIMVVCVIIMQSVYVDNSVMALVMGLLIGIEFYHLRKAEGTVLMKSGKIVTIVICLVAFLLGYFNQHLTILPNLTTTLALMIPLECIGLYMICQNHPPYTMTYKFSFKNRRRRYF